MNISGLKPRPQRGIQRVALVTGDGQAKGDNSEVFADPDEVEVVELLARVVVEQPVVSRRGHEEAAVVELHLAVLQQVVQHGQHVPLGLLHAVQHQDSTLQRRTHRTLHTRKHHKTIGCLGVNAWGEVGEALHSPPLNAGGKGGRGGRGEGWEGIRGRGGKLLTCVECVVK